jgi:hypothetical protein
MVKHAIVKLLANMAHIALSSITNATDMIMSYVINIKWHCQRDDAAMPSSSAPSTPPEIMP